MAMNDEIFDNRLRRLDNKRPSNERRFQAACAAMEGLISSPNLRMGRNADLHRALAETAVKYADALIAEIEKGGAE